MTSIANNSSASSASDCQSMGTCHDERMERIYNYLDGQLSREDIDEVQAHLEECPECNAEHDLECIIRSAVKRSCQEKAPVSLKEAIIAKISEVQSQTTH